YPDRLIYTAKNRRLIQQVSISPDQKYIAFITYINGKRTIWLHDNATGKQKKIFSAEPKFDQKADNTYPVMDWHPGSDILTFINEEEGSLKIYFYRLSTGKREERNMLYFDKILSFDYAPSGNRIIMSAVKDGLTDLYIHTLASGTNNQVTRDVADDLNPRYTGRGNNIVFTSNRINDTLSVRFDPLASISPVYELFTYDLDGGSRVLTRLTEGEFVDRNQGIFMNDRELVYLGNKNGTINQFRATFDSTISYIDTTTHFRYFINSAPITNYNRNIITYDATGGGEVAEVVFEKNRYRLFTGKK
ncbi:MAG: hypothetical protein R2744_12415, partial [Bacteroidales bacterium]